MEFTGRLEQMLGRFVASKQKGLTPDGAIEALVSINAREPSSAVDLLLKKQYAAACSDHAARSCIGVHTDPCGVLCKLRRPLDVKLSRELYDLAHGYARC